jgi:hypothetical protein
LSITALTTGYSLRAWTDAFIKADINPSLTPCFFVNASCIFVRMSMNADMSISLKVVRLALVFWDSLRRRAMVCRILFMGTRVSNLAPVISEGAFLLETELTPAVDEGDEDGVGVGAAGATGVAAFGTGVGSAA